MGTSRLGGREGQASPQGTIWKGSHCQLGPEGPGAERLGSARKASARNSSLTQSSQLGVKEK